MAEYIPGTSVTRSAAITALRHAPAPDDSDVDARNSIMNVDYLSHEWQEEADVWASWRHTTRHKNDIANGVRLENASWRTWWKQRNNLKTISPETLNWLKDSDVTWLYGPLHTAADPVPPIKVATAEERLDLVKAIGKKPILKHRSISELLSIPRGSSPSLESIHLDSIPEGEEPERPVLLQTKSESYITKTGVRRVSPPLPELAHAPDLIVGEEGTDSPRLGSDTDSMTSGHPKRHISFNTFVEQCIAIDSPSRAALVDIRTPWRVGFGAASHGYEDNEHAVMYEDDDESTVLTMRSTSSSGQSSAASSRRPSSSNNSRSNSHSSERVTIQAIAPTLLKTQYDTVPGESPAVVYVPPLGSPYSEDPTIAAARFDHPPSPSDYTTGQATLQLGTPSPRAAPTHSQWEDGDEDRGVGFDYFNGPDVGTAEEYESTRVASSSRVTPPASSVNGAVTAASNQTGRVVTPRSPPSSPRTAKMPGKSILKPSVPDAAVTEALREASTSASDSYFSVNPNTIPPPSSKSNHSVVIGSLDDKISSILAVPAATEAQPPSSPESSTLSPGPPPTRGRSAVRIPGSAIGIADRERSASSKGSSPIGSVSPNSRPIAAAASGSGRSSVVKIGAASRKPNGRTAVSPPVAGGVRSSSRSTVSSRSSDASSPPPTSAHETGVSGASVARSHADGSAPRREDGFQPAKSSPVKSPPSKKRLSMDIVPVLPAQSQPAPAQLSPGIDPPSAGSASRPPTVHTSSPLNIKGSVPRAAVKVTDLDSDDEGAPDGMDGFRYSTNPTPVNSPTHALKPLPVSISSGVGTGTSKEGASRASSSAGKGRGGIPSASIGLGSPATRSGDEAIDARDDGTLVSRAVDIVTSARGFIGAIWNAGVGHSATPFDPHATVNGRRTSDG